MDRTNNIVEIIRKQDAMMLKNRKKKLISVEIDPDTYIAKEVLHSLDKMYSLSSEIYLLRQEIRELKKAVNSILMTAKQAEEVKTINQQRIEAGLEPVNDPDFDRKLVKSY